MSLDLQRQRLFDRAHFVAGVGDPRLDRFCVMSFVAFIAGEWFGDRPKTASPVIRKLVIPLNDRFDTATRQRLKPFAPRIIGTNDGRDPERAALIYETIVAKVLPAAAADLCGREPAPADAGAPLRVAAPLPSRLRRHVDYIVTARGEGRFDVLAKEAGHFLAGVAETVSDHSRRAWYHAVALDLVDLLCDVGAETRPASGSPVRASPLSLVGQAETRSGVGRAAPQ